MTTRASPSHGSPASASGEPSGGAVVVVVRRARGRHRGRGGGRGRRAGGRRRGGGRRRRAWSSWWSSWSSEAESVTMTSSGRFLLLWRDVKSTPSLESAPRWNETGPGPVTRPSRRRSPTCSATACRRRPGLRQCRRPVVPGERALVPLVGGGPHLGTVAGGVLDPQAQRRLRDGASQRRNREAEVRLGQRARGRRRAATRSRSCRRAWPARPGRRPRGARRVSTAPAGSPITIGPRPIAVITSSAPPRRAAAPKAR